MQLLLTWQLQMLISAVAEGERRDNAAVSALSAALESFQTSLEDILDGSQHSDEVRDTVARVLGDLFHMFDEELLEEDGLSEVAVRPSQPTLRAFWRQCEAILSREVRWAGVGFMGFWVDKWSRVCGGPLISVSARVVRLGGYLGGEGVLGDGFV